MRAFLLATLVLPGLAVAERSSREDDAAAPPSTPEAQRAMFHLPPGFEIQLVAAEPEIQKPMNLNFDAAGRLWVTGTELYPWPAKVDALGQPIANFDETWKTMSGAFDPKKAPTPPEKATDTVRVLSDFGHDGRARKIEVFADGLNIPIGIQPLPRKNPQIAQIFADEKASAASSENLRQSAKSADPRSPKGDSVIVFSIPKIWRLTDTDGDGRADLREPLYGDFGFRDTHGMSSNYLYWIDGWIYGCHGFANRSVVKDGSGNVTEMNSGNTYRFRPDGSRFEIYTHGQTNPFGLTVDDWGNFYTADSHSKPVMMLLPGAHYAGIGKTHDGLGFAPTIMDHDHGSSSIAGVAWYGADHFPPEFHGNTFSGNPVTRRINRDRYEWHGSTPKAIEMPDFLTCDDPWFRPVQVKLGPDGALWIADFYNPIIGHYEQPLADPRRDHKHGRIWRIIYRGEKGDAPAPTLPDLAKLDAKALMEKFADANLTVRTLATNEIVVRGHKNLQPTLQHIMDAAEKSGPSRGEIPQPQEKLRPLDLAAVHSMWTMCRLAPELGIELEQTNTGREFHYVHGTRALLERQRRAIEQGLPLGEERNAYPPPGFLFADFAGITKHLLVAEPIARRAAAAGAGFLPHVRLDILVSADKEAPADDLFLKHSIRVALRERLKRQGTYGYATGFAEQDAFAANLLAEMSLAVPTSNSADFLLAHLRRVRFVGPRAGEYLRHAVLHLPEDKLGEVSTLMEGAAPSVPLAEALVKSAKERGWNMPDQLGGWVRRTVLGGLDGPESDRAIGALRETTWTEKFAPLEQIVLDSKQSGARRGAALEAAMNLPGSVALAARALADSSSLPLRKKAAELLGQNRDTAGDACAPLLAALPSAPAELALSITASLAKTDADFAALLDVLEAGKASPAPLRNRLIAILVTQRADALRARADALTKDLPPEDARLDQIIAARVKAFGGAKANTAKGAEIFAQQCAVCHRFRGQGGNVGPNLDGVAARGAHRLIEDILDPNRNVDPTFRQTTLELHDSRMLIGVNLREEGGAILLTDAAGQTQSTPKADVKSQTQSRLSLMPPAFETTISAEDFNFLLAYLLQP